MHKFVGGLTDFQFLELGQSSAFDATPSGKFPHGLVDLTGSSPAPTASITLCAAATIVLTTWIVTFLHCSLFLLNPGLFKDRGHALFTIHLLVPEQSLAGTV